MGVGPEDGAVAVGGGAAVSVASDDGASLGGGEEPAVGAGFDHFTVRAEGDERGMGVTGCPPGGR